MIVTPYILNPVNMSKAYRFIRLYYSTNAHLRQHIYQN